MLFPLSPHARFVRTHTLCLRPRQALYTYIPKNACSTMRYSVAVANGYPEGEATLKQIYGGLKDLLATPREMRTAPAAFVVLRCPYRRIASAFLNKVVREGSRARAMLAQNRGLFAGNTRGAMTAAESDAIAALTFPGFIALLKDMPRARIDHHFRPQTDFLLARGYDEVFAVETLAADAPRLHDRMGLILRDARGYMQHDIGRLAKASGDASTLGVAALLELKTAGTAPAYAALYSDAARQAVASFFRDDIALYARHFGAEALLFPD